MSSTGRRGTLGGPAGYALIEVLVAATLLGVVLTVLVEGFGQGATVLAGLHDRWTALTLARGIAAVPGAEGRMTEGRFDRPFEEFAWEVRGGRITVSWPAGALSGRKRVSLPIIGGGDEP